MKIKQINVWDNETEKSVKIVLDFVERWNKQDKEQDVADAAGTLAEKLVEIEDERHRDTCPCEKNCECWGGCWKCHNHDQ